MTATSRACLLAAAVTALASASTRGAPGRLPPGILAQIPITIERNKTILPVTAGGATLRMILDTGMAQDGLLVFRRDRIDTSGFGPAFTATARGAGSGGGSEVLVFDGASFDVGGLAFEKQRAMVMGADAFTGFPTDGVIGHSLFGHYVVEIDYDRLVLTLRDSPSFRVGPGWESLPITFKGNRIPWVDLQVGIGSEPLVRLSAYIDSASSEALELLTRDVNRFSLPPVTTEKYLGRGLSGDIHGRAGKIDRLRLGSQELKDVLVAIAPAAVRSRQEGADAVLSNDALRRFNVVFDYSRRALHIRPNGHFREPFGIASRAADRRAAQEAPRPAQHHGAPSHEAIDEMRDRGLQPERIMDAIGLRPGMTVGEAGAGYGYFTFKMSRRVGPTGMVYANDIGSLREIETRSAAEKLANIRTVTGEPADPRFPRRDLDMIVVFDCLFEFGQPAAWMKNARRYLKPGGRLVIVDPDRAKMTSDHFLSRQQIHGFGREAGYTVMGVDDSFLKTHAIVVLEVDGEVTR